MGMSHDEKKGGGGKAIEEKAWKKSPLPLLFSLCLRLWVGKKEEETWLCLKST